MIMNYPVDSLDRDVAENEARGNAHYAATLKTIRDRFQALEKAEKEQTLRVVLMLDPDSVMAVIKQIKDAVDGET